MPLVLRILVDFLETMGPLGNGNVEFTNVKSIHHGVFLISV